MREEFSDFTLADAEFFLRNSVSARPNVKILAAFPDFALALQNFVQCLQNFLNAL